MCRLTCLMLRALCFMLLWETHEEGSEREENVPQSLGWDEPNAFVFSLSRTEDSETDLKLSRAHI